jgi:D-glycero-D-manno-heptose 1,7-bisphosphate phosphatase
LFLEGYTLLAYRAIFLDRDGVINKHRRDYVKDIQEFEILPCVPNYLTQMRRLGFKLIIITNQSAVNRGLLSIEQLDLIHDFLIQELVGYGCPIDGILYCPHRPDEDCACRKPKIKMFLDASRLHNIDLSKSWLIGDNETDIEPGNKIGCNTIKIKTDASLKKALDVIRNRTRRQQADLHPESYTL